MSGSSFAFFARMMGSHRSNSCMSRPLCLWLADDEISRLLLCVCWNDAHSPVVEWYHRHASFSIGDDSLDEGVNIGRYLAFPRSPMCPINLINLLL